ncbi:MAG TPA: PASTA domain-containing protein [Candidatus Cloacimonadota bacterium]|nr:PASTA domain-containing protein [Candidatus Cloacimonadota bacterium]HPT71827.1 PASTA domain-containing protein [Candidatus Cloacimonadota bacterium]
MDSEKVRSIVVALGIMVGIVLVTAIIVSQIFMPLVFGRGNTVTVPNLVGMDIKAANTESADNQLHISEATYANSDEYAKGIIISQEPSPGTKVKADGSISVIVSKGGELSVVPTVEGLELNRALSRIKNAGLKPVVKDSLSSDQVEANHILRVWPSAGSGLTPGSSVYLSVSTGSGTAPAQPSEPDTGTR